MKKSIFALILCLLLLLSACRTQPPTEAPTQAPTQPTADCSVRHTDEDDNGQCDLCDTSVLVMLEIYGVNDLHGKLTDSSNQPGAEELTTYIRNLWDTVPNLLLLSMGDMWQGTAESNLTEGNMVTEWMNEMDFHAMTLGNHEFDWGEAPIAENAQLAEFPFLAINIYERATNQPVSYCQSSTIVDMGMVQIGLIGAIGDCYSSISPEQTEGIYFKTVMFCCQINVFCF